MKKNKIKSKQLISVLIMSLFVVMTMLNTGCKKDNDPGTPPGKMLSINVQTEGLIVREMTKSFDLSKWTYNYNPNVYELKFTGVNNTYTFNKSIQELKNGFNVNILPDVYVITYTSIHTTDNAGVMDNKLDITINETKNISTNTDLTLTANNDDYLVVMDNEPKFLNGHFPGNPNPGSFYNSPDLTYKFMYCNIEGDMTITYQDKLGYDIEKVLNVKKNNIYHIVNGVNGQTNINILPFNYSVVGW